MSLTIQAPLTGRAVPLEKVPDPVFSSGMVGSGVAVDPKGRQGEITVCAPAAGTLIRVMPHAFVVMAEDCEEDGKKVGILVHVGLDTVQLNGQGFTVHRAQGDRVAAGDPVVSVDLEVVRDAGLSPLCPVVAMEHKDPVELSHEGDISRGENLFTL